MFHQHPEYWKDDKLNDPDRIADLIMGVILSFIIGLASGVLGFLISFLLEVAE